MPEALIIQTVAEAVNKEVHGQEEQGITSCKRRLMCNTVAAIDSLSLPKDRADFHVSNHALGTKKKPYTSLTCEDLLEDSSGSRYNDRHQEEFEAINSRTLTTIPRWLNQRISEGNVTEAVSASGYV
jgi:hypothetical protein